MYEIELSPGGRLEQSGLNLTEVERIVSRIKNVTEGGKQWSPKIKDIINEEEGRDAEAVRGLFRAILIAQREIFLRGEGNLLDLEEIVPDFQGCDAIWALDGGFPQSVAGICSIGNSENSTRYVVDLLSKYIAAL